MSGSQICEPLIFSLEISIFSYSLKLLMRV